MKYVSEDLYLTVIYCIFFRNIMNNKVFYQHPNLMRALGMHETVMEVMVNVLGGGGDSKVRMVVFSLYSVFCQSNSCLSELVEDLNSLSLLTLHPVLSLFLFRRSDFPRW